MKKYFFTGISGLVLFEILCIYFIMPFPGSQQSNSISFVYFLFAWRWVFRGLFFFLVIAGLRSAFSGRARWISSIALLIVAVVVTWIHTHMAAEKMFLPPQQLIMAMKTGNQVHGSRLVIGVERNGEAKAYPVEFLAYHHQVRDSIGGQAVMITYCSVCRTGRVFEPKVRGAMEQFRLVGMDHYNALFEDASTGSWWRQANGEAIAGSRKGERLPEVESKQMTVDMWFAMYPHGKVMQPDPVFTDKYDVEAAFEQGKSTGSLTRTDSLSWKEKSWVVGIETAGASKAYDWKELKRKRIIQDKVGSTSIVLILANDDQSFTAFECRPGSLFTLDENNIIRQDSLAYDFRGRELSSNFGDLKPVRSYQEFWHSWRTFH